MATERKPLGQGDAPRESPNNKVQEGIERLRNSAPEGLKEAIEETGRDFDKVLDDATLVNSILTDGAQATHILLFHSEETERVQVARFVLQDVMARVRNLTDDQNAILASYAIEATEQMMYMHEGPDDHDNAE